MLKNAVLELARERYPEAGDDTDDQVLFQLLVDVANAYRHELEKVHAVKDSIGCLLQGLRENLKPNDPLPTDGMTTCAFCHKTSNDPCANGWEPWYWDEELNQELNSPVCPDCRKARLVFDHDADDYVLPRTTLDHAIELPSDG